ncbi:D-alanyl-D-alanine carboxypeptidase family protein [Lichenibacterium dinghuense]|uniref:D-alanyl-D-alanine carboxypeptidase family protein n=1 Tax=Lichenibacterium dinghuense TaxID=2895977 RepID=UPI001F266A38|nr:D-alanyl-D-alanine carboxypeptidase family protein [Lichenibacterium sp. 6Y81]
MMFKPAIRRSLLSVLALGVASLGPARANPTIVVDANSGEVLYKDMATAPWFPASTTKLMTVYVALSKVREGKISLDTPLRVSAYAASMIPSKMGFRPGTLVTLDNALKMLMVKSPNDIAVTIAEGISGSVPAFADEMNSYAARIGLHESHFANPNGLHDPNHWSSARDMAMIARALITQFPEEHDLFNIGTLQFGGKLIPNHNGLLGRYDGVDGMKTGYTCAGGYNVVESATRGDRRLLVVIMGAPSTNQRNLRSVALFEKYFANPGQGLGNVADLGPSDIVAPPDMHVQMCGPGRHAAIQEAEAEDAAIAPTDAGAPATGLAALMHPRDAFTPVRVFIGATPGTNIAPVGSIEEAQPGPAATAKADAPVPAATVPAALAQAPADAAAVVAPLALAGAAAPAALAAANKVVKGRGHGLVAAKRDKAPARPAAKAKPVVKPSKAAAKAPAKATKAAAKPSKKKTASR